MAVVAVDPMLDPGFLLPFAAAERWAREVWLSTLPAARRPDDVLSGEELHMVHRILTSKELAEVTIGPGKALVDGFRALELEWRCPHIVADCNGCDWDLTAVAPPLFRKTAKERWTVSRREAAEREI